MKLIFIRHGDPDYEKDSLTEKGFREAELLKKRVSQWDVKQFYCSPLGRAQATAKPFLKEMAREAVICDWLKEFFVPIKDPYTGQERIAWDFMPAYWTNEPLLYSKDSWTKAPVMRDSRIGDAYREVCEGIDKVLAHHGYIRKDGYYITEQGNEDTLVFVCHLGVTFTILSHLLGLAPSVLWQGFFIAPTSVTVLCTEERIKGEAYFRCKCMGDTLHLAQGGEPVSNSGFFCEIYDGKM